MASIEDRWFSARPGSDGKKVRKPRYGTGKRWKVHYTDPDGRQRSESFDRRVDADRFKATVEADILRGVFIDPDAGKITLRKYTLEVWLPAQTFGSSTRERVESRLRLHILPDIGSSRGLGSYRLSELARSPSVIQAWLRGLQAKPDKPLSASHIRLVHGTLSTILAAAVVDERIVKNPAKAETVKPPKPDKRRIIPWEASRVAAIRAGMPHRYQAMADAGSGAGLRQGEVFGLSPDDVDWLRKVIHVRRQVKIVGGRRVFAPPKGDKDRDVPLAESLALRFSAHLAVYPAAAVTLLWKEPGGKPVTATLMFTKADEGAIWRNDFNRYVWHPALRAAGIMPGRENGFHQLRHHFASTLLRDGVDIRTLAEYLGHDDPGFTLGTYCHLMPGAPDRMRQAVDRAFSDLSDCPDIARGGSVRPLPARLPLHQGLGVNVCSYPRGNGGNCTRSCLASRRRRGGCRRGRRCGRSPGRAWR
jgi:integrase